MSKQNLKRNKPVERTRPVTRSRAKLIESAPLTPHLDFTDIEIEKHRNYMVFTIVPNPVNSLSIEAMKQLKEAFLLAKKDSNCLAVLLHSRGIYFCTGIDLTQLIGSDKKKGAEEMAAAIKDLMMTIAAFTKPVVAAVNGRTVGIGLALLTLCDVVIASDKAIFHIPSPKIGFMPVAATTFLLPRAIGSTTANDLMLNGRRLTAEQALMHGLITEVLPDSKLMSAAIPRINRVISGSLIGIEETKSAIRCQILEQLKYHLECEECILPSFWLKPETQENMKYALDSGWIYD